MLKKLLSTKRMRVISLSVLVVSVCTVAVISQHFFSSSRVVLKDELGIQRKLLHDGAGDHACHCWKPFITGVTISNITSNSASIKWECDKPSTYQVKYGLNSTKDKYFPTTTPTAPYKSYSVVLTGLTANTTYHVGPSSTCKTDCGNTEVGLRRNSDTDGKSDWTFKTLPATSITDDPNKNKIVSPTVISEARAAEITASEVTINWSTNNPATSYVEYGSTTSYGSKSEENIIGEHHHTIQLFGLDRGATYHARAVSRDETTGATVYSPDFTFTMPTSEHRIVNMSTVLNEPNPCFERTTFVYYLYQPAKRVTIDIFTLSGKTVANLEAPRSTLMEGHNTVLWDLRDNAQKRLPAGLYSYRVTFYTADNHVDVKNANLMIRN